MGMPGQNCLGRILVENSPDLALLPNLLEPVQEELRRSTKVVDTVEVSLHEAAVA